MDEFGQLPAPEMGDNVIVTPWCREMHLMRKGSGGRKWGSRKWGHEEGANFTLLQHPLVQEDALQPLLRMQDRCMLTLLSKAFASRECGTSILCQYALTIFLDASSIQEQPCSVV